MSIVVDFARYASDGTWTSAAVDGVTGSTSLYHSSGASDLVLTVVGSTLHVTGTIPAGPHRAGWVFAFDSCVTSWNNLGLSFETGGTLVGMNFTLAVQTDADYPIDVGSGKGSCAFTSCATKESECRFPSVPVPVPSDFLLYNGLSEFKGGSPEDSVSYGSAILGLKFDLQCNQDIADCAVDFTLGMVKFYSA